MTKATEMREMLIAGQEKRNAERKQIANTYCEEVLEKEIAKRACEGSATLVHFVGKLISIDFVKAYLEENGYAVAVEENKLTIRW